MTNDERDKRIEELEAEVERLRARTHEIQEREDKKHAALKTRMDILEITESIYENTIKRGQQWFWDVEKMAIKPYGLSRADALKIGTLITNREQAESRVAELESELKQYRAAPTPDEVIEEVEVATERLDAVDPPRGVQIPDNPDHFFSHSRWWED
ncbi:MAG: hypothetical protein GY832_23665 [Chloroflexi bacterium]|nr:hypothetical protein [Chloroflexota bacterium]